MALELTFKARDGYPLAGTLFPAETTRGAVLVAGAMGVRRRYYRAFAETLAATGLSALTFDYRGIGDSKSGPTRGFDATMLDWARNDLGGAMDALSSRSPDAPLGWVGHSLGGQLMGFAEAPVRAAVFVASQSGYWRNWSGGARVLMKWVWTAIPRVVDVVGHLPMARLGQGEDVPPQVARDWATWGQEPKYLKRTADAKGGLGYSSWRGALRSYAIADDEYAPLRSVEELVKLYRAAKSEIRIVDPREFGQRSIGHFGFFRPSLETTLWREATEWLLLQIGGP